MRSEYVVYWENGPRFALSQSASLSIPCLQPRVGRVTSAHAPISKHLFRQKHKEQVKCQFSSQCHYSVCFQFFNSAGKPTNMTAGHSFLCHTPPESLMTSVDLLRWSSRTTVSPCCLCVVIAGNALANPLTLQQWKASTLTQSFASILILGAMQSGLFVKSNSHDSVVCAVNV